jgi:hypothetical protein
MEPQVHTFLTNRLIDHVVIEHIYPYAYNCIPKELSRDIRTFHSDMNLIDYMYHYYIRPSVLYTDIMYYLNNTDHMEKTNMPAFFHIIRRFYADRDLSDSEVSTIYYKLCYFDNDDEVYIGRVRMIIGMLTPEERTDFINRYLLG